MYLEILILWPLSIINEGGYYEQRLHSKRT